MHRNMNMQALVMNYASAGALPPSLLEPRNDVAGGVAHDMNNVLQIIAGNLALLARDLGEHPAARRHMAGAMAGVQMGTRLAQAFLGRAAEGTLLDLREVLVSMRLPIASAVGESVEVTYDIPSIEFRSPVDAAALEHVVLNLAINGRDAMGGAGRLRISLSSELIAGSAFNTICVADTGSGMSPELVAKVFEPHFTTKGSRGTGLGLAGVARFVEDAGGDVVVDSEIGRGTRMTIRIPAA